MTPSNFSFFISAHSRHHYGRSSTVRLHFHPAIFRSQLDLVNNLTNQCTSNVREPNVRFGKPDEKASGYRSFGYRTFGLDRFIFSAKLDRFIYSQRPKSESSDFRQCRNPNDQLFEQLIVRFSVVRFFLICSV